MSKSGLDTCLPLLMRSVAMARVVGQPTGSLRTKHRLAAFLKDSGRKQPELSGCFWPVAVIGDRHLPARSGRLLNIRRLGCNGVAGD